MASINDIAFCSVAFGERYVEQIHRLIKSIKDIYPEANIFSWVDELPTGSQPFLNSLYGFKVHAVKYAREQGYEKIIWLDPACILVDKVDYWFEIIEKYGVIAARDESKLIDCVSDKALRYFKSPCLDMWHLVGGSVYVFDFSLDLCQKIFEDWEKAEAAGEFGSQHEASNGLINKHRNDESCLAMSLYLNGSKPVPYDLCKYNNNDAIVIKKHFR